MSDSKKEVNYSPDAVAAIKAAAPLNLEGAKSLAKDLDKTYRSIIAKAKSLGVAYVSKPAPARKPKAETKAEIVGDIARLVGGVSLDGLEKAPAGALRSLRANIPLVSGFNVDMDES